MIVKIICVVVMLTSCLDAVPPDYRYKTLQDTSQCKIENRLGLSTKKDQSSTTETEEVLDDEELHGLLNNFWAVDNLPKQSPYVSVIKMPDVYLDQDQDRPRPICDMMPVEKSEITEEARDLHASEFGERSLYDPSMQMMDNIGNRNLQQQQYPDYMPPPYPPGTLLTYDFDYDGDNNTLHPQEDVGNFCPDQVLKEKEPEEPAVAVCTEKTEVTTTVEVNTTTPCNVTKEVTTPTTMKPKDKELSDVEILTSISTEKTTHLKNENVIMKISDLHKNEKKKKGKK